MWVSFVLPVTFIQRHIGLVLNMFRPFIIDRTCSHCKRFAPTYSAVAKSLHEKNEKKEDSEKIFVSKVDGAKERILSSRFSLRGYPTFFVIDGWDVYEYEGQRSLDALEKFVERGYKKNEVR